MNTVLHLTEKEVGVAYSRNRKTIGTDAKILYGIINIISRMESDRMPERKQMVHFCAKCGKEMSYKEKKMIYIYDVIHKKHFASSNFCPKKRMAINLCADCCYEIEKIICEWKGE